MMGRLVDLMIPHLVYAILLFIPAVFSREHVTTKYPLLLLLSFPLLPIFPGFFSRARGRGC